MSTSSDKPATGPDSGVTPHLTVSDGPAAVAFYVEAFGAVERFRQMAEDGVRIFHCFMGLNDGLLMLNDHFPEFGDSASELKPAGVTIHLQVPDADAAWKRATDAGATVVVPLANQPWGLRYGVLRDPFGHKWSIGTRLRG